MRVLVVSLWDSAIGMLSLMRINLAKGAMIYRNRNLTSSMQLMTFLSQGLFGTPGLVD
jgi:hypothetical protein